MNGAEFSFCPPSASLSPFSANQIVFRHKSCFVFTCFASLLSSPGKSASDYTETKVTIFSSPAGMSLTKLSPANYSQPGRVLLVTSSLGTGKWLTFFTV